MHLFDNGTQVATLGSPQPAVGTPGYAATGTPGTIAPTVFDPDLANTIVQELAGLVGYAGIALDRTNNAQVLAALQLLFGKSYTFDVSAPPSSPIAMNPRDRVVVTFSGVTSVPLHIASVPGLYTAKVMVSATNTTNADVGFAPNDTAYPNGFSYWNNHNSDTNLNALGSGTAGAGFANATVSPFLGNIPKSDNGIANVGSFFFDLFEGPSGSDTINDIGPWMLEMAISTFTVAKMIKASGGVAGGPSMHWAKWNDTTTAWTSLGTIADNLGATLTGAAVITREA